MSRGLHLSVPMVIYAHTLLGSTVSGCVAVRGGRVSSIVLATASVGAGSKLARRCVLMRCTMVLPACRKIRGW